MLVYAYCMWRKFNHQHSKHLPQNFSVFAHAPWNFLALISLTIRSRKKANATEQQSTGDGDNNRCPHWQTLVWGCWEIPTLVYKSTKTFLLLKSEIAYTVKWSILWKIMRSSVRVRKHASISVHVSTEVVWVWKDMRVWKWWLKIHF